MNQKNNVIIHAENVKKKFGDFYALKGVSMDVHEGEVVVVLGPSGSGKSTFIRTINQLEKHDEGKIIVDGTELNDDIKNLETIRSNVGMVFQQFNLFPHLTVKRNVALAPQKVKGLSVEEADSIAMPLLERSRHS
jgi:ABC-type polar amino acid transport system, ATPase component